MDQDLKWLELRVNLLRTHLNQQQSLIVAEKEAVNSLKVKHQWERESLTSKKVNSLEYINLIVRQAQEVNSLAGINNIKRQALRCRQREEVLELDRQITQQNGLSL